MVPVWVVVSLHLLTTAGLAVSAYFCYRLDKRITDVIKFFDTNKKVVPIDPENVFIHLRDN